MTKRTIYRHLLLLAALPALVLAACSREEMADGSEGPDAPDGKIRFEIGFAPKDGAIGDNPQTRVATDANFKCSWEDGDAIGIYAVEHGQPLAASGNPIHNVKLTYSSGGKWTGQAYWPTAADGRTLDFYAYYPYTVTATNPTQISFSVAQDQSGTFSDGKSNFNRSHLLTAKTDNSGEGCGHGNTVTLNFTHALAMVQVKVGANMSGIKTVRLNGCITETTFNLFTQTTAIAPTATSHPVTMYACPNSDNTPGTFAYRALVPVQTIASGTVMFRFESNESVLYQSLKLASPVFLVTGQAETFDFSALLTSGTVSSRNCFACQLAGSDLGTIEHLKEFGEMTETNFTNIRNNMTALTVLDLGGAIVLNNGKPKHAFYDKSSLTNFVSPRNIGTIGAQAFYTYSGLSGNLIIPDGVKRIDSDTFSAYSDLIPNHFIKQKLI